MFYLNWTLERAIDIEESSEKVTNKGVRVEVKWSRWRVCFEKGDYACSPCSLVQNQLVPLSICWRISAQKMPLFLERSSMVPDTESDPLTFYKCLFISAQRIRVSFWDMWLNIVPKGEEQAALVWVFTADWLFLPRESWLVCGAAAELLHLPLLLT